jgi:hypothetical protein
MARHEPHRSIASACGFKPCIHRPDGADFTPACALATAYISRQDLTRRVDGAARASKGPAPGPSHPLVGAAPPRQTKKFGETRLSRHAHQPGPRAAGSRSAVCSLRAAPASRAGPATANASWRAGQMLRHRPSWSPRRDGATSRSRGGLGGAIPHGRARDAVDDARPTPRTGWNARWRPGDETAPAASTNWRPRVDGSAPARCTPGGGGDNRCTGYRLIYALRVIAASGHGRRVWVARRRPSWPPRP